MGGRRKEGGGGKGDGEEAIEQAREVAGVYMCSSWSPLLQVHMVNNNSWVINVL